MADQALQILIRRYKEAIHFTNLTHRDDNPGLYDDAMDTLAEIQADPRFSEVTDFILKTQTLLREYNEGRTTSYKNEVGEFYSRRKRINPEEQ